MTRAVPNWENELWSYIDQCDGVTCPVYDRCKVKHQVAWCIGDHEKVTMLRKLLRLVDDDEPALNSRELSQLDFVRNFELCHMLKLVRMLSEQYLRRAGIKSPPVPLDIISMADSNKPTEVMQVSLKAYHGAIWYLNDGWVIQTNKNDTPARQRFTIFHEVFHILAHCKASPVFKKVGVDEGSFNERLADRFAGTILVPPRWVEEYWSYCKDINQLAAIFEAPKSVVWLRLKAMGLI